MPNNISCLRYLLVIYLLFGSGLVSGQTLTGHIIDKETGMGLYPVAVVNLATRISVLSNADGTYSIAAKAGEPVAFTFMGYKAQQKTVPYSLSAAETDIVMQPISYTLDEAVIRSLTKYQKDSIERVATYRRPLAAQHAGFMSPVSALAELFAQKSRQTFRFQNNFYKWETQQFIDSRYTPDVVHAMTKLDGDTLAHFMSINIIPYEYARTATDIELKMWIRSNYKEYMKAERYKDIPRIKDSLVKPVN